MRRIALWLLALLAPAQALALTPDPVAVQRWADDIYRPMIADGRIAGAVVTVVSRDRTILLRGYGMADAQTGRRMDPSRTPVRSGSISKTMTAIAVMQLVEAGKVDLDGDVNRYLKRLRLPARFGPVTVRSLLAQSAGFQERWRDTLEDDPGSEVVDAQALQARSTRQARPAGVYSSYANYHYSLLQAVIEDVTGLSYRRYVTGHILRPLGMTDTFLEVPGQLPMDRIAREHSIGRDGLIRVEPFHYKAQDYLGSGGHFWTGADMARYMQALLRAAAGRDTPLMQAQSFATMVRMQGRSSTTRHMGFGFHLDHGRRPPPGGRADLPTMFGHNGETGSFRGYMWLFPQDDLAIFIEHVGSCAWWEPAFLLRPGLCRPERSGLSVRDAFADAFIGRRRPLPVPLAGLDARPFAGRYLSTRRAENPQQAILSWIQERALDPEILVTAQGPATVLLNAGSAALDGLYTAVTSEEFVRADGARIAFAGRDGGRPITLLFNYSRAAERIGLFQSPRLLAGAILLLLPLSLLTSILLMRVSRPSRLRALPLAAAGLAGAAVAWPFVETYLLRHYYRLDEVSYGTWSLLTYAAAVASALTIGRAGYAICTRQLTVRAATLCGLHIVLVAGLMTACYRLGLFTPALDAALHGI